MTQLMKKRPSDGDHSASVRVHSDQEPRLLEPSKLMAENATLLAALKSQQVELEKYRCVQESQQVELEKYRRVQESKQVEVEKYRRVQESQQVELEKYRRDYRSLEAEFTKQRVTLEDLQTANSKLKQDFQTRHSKYKPNGSFIYKYLVNHALR